MSMTGEDLEETQPTVIVKTRFERAFGFKPDDISSWLNFVRLMNRACHPASLGVFRVCYGILMINDLLEERGFYVASVMWGNSDTCHFPLIHGMNPLPLHWMIVVYIIMTFGVLGILFGFMFRISCAMFAFPYWYILLLDRTAWNNHSYIFGLIAVILLCSDANRYWSLDGLIWKHKRNAEIPLWNYYIPRFQLFILYFVAGLKKFDSDWTHGYSMDLASNWVFAPFRLFFSKDTVNMYFVHTAGHMIDLTLAYLLFFDATRPVGLIIGFAFNFMNATIFYIGMFPYMCIASLPLFCPFDWPVVWFRKLPNRFKFLAPADAPLQPSDHCIYTKESIESSKQCNQNGAEISAKSSTRNKSNKIRFYHKFFAVAVIVYSVEQLFLPYSHFITQGHTIWSPGVYGYSWDMMIAISLRQHIRITYVVKDTGEFGHIRPNSFVLRSNRWTSTADSVKLYAKCLEKRLADRNVTNIELFFDVWESLNNRFIQRSLHPHVNMLTAEWSLFKRSPWVFPLLDELTVWRDEIMRIRDATNHESKYNRVSFVADFPGQILNNYVQKEIDQVNVTVLAGKVEVELPSQNITYFLKAEETAKLSSEQFHNIKTVSDRPSCFYYTYLDMYQKVRQEGYTEYVTRLKTEQNVTDVSSLNVTKAFDDDEMTILYKNHITSKREKKTEGNQWMRIIAYYFKINLLLRAWDNIKLAVRIYRSGRKQDIVRYEITRENYPEVYRQAVQKEEHNEYAMLYLEPVFNETTNETVYIESFQHSSFLQHNSIVQLSEDNDK